MSIPFVLLVAGVYAFYNSFQGPFVLDDLHSILFNQQIRSLWPPWNALSPPKNCAVAGRPVVNLSLAVNYALGELSVSGYHVFNLVFHILGALVLFGVVRRTLSRAEMPENCRRRPVGLALAVALIWVVHPLQTESVTYTIQRTELMMGLFFLLTLYCFIRSLYATHVRAWQVAAVIACALGMGSKEVMVSCPLVVLLYDRVFVSSSFREILRRRGTFYACLAATWLILVALVTGGPRTRAVGLGFEKLTPWDYARTQFGVIVHYLRLCFWPHPLVFDYEDWPIARAVTDFLPWAALIALLVTATLVALYRQPKLGFLGAWFFLILGPTSSVLPITTEIAAERRMYLPLAAVVAAVVLAGDAVVGRACERLRLEGRARTRVAAALVVIAVGVLGYVAARRNEDYRSVISIWTDAVMKRPNNSRARMNLGHFLGEEGRIEEATHQYAEAVRAKPESAMTHYGLGVMLARQGKRDEAIACYREALRLDPDYASAHSALASALSSEGKSDEAILHFREALRISPDDAGTQYNLGITLGREGRFEEAIEHVLAAVNLRPGWQQAEAALRDFRSQAAHQGR